MAGTRSLRMEVIRIARWTRLTPTSKPRKSITYEKRSIQRVDGRESAMVDGQYRPLGRFGVEIPIEEFDAANTANEEA